MSRFVKVLFPVILILIMAATGVADEGMWMPHQMTDLDLQTKGLQMNPADLYKKDGTGLMSAVVHLGGGTGEFVSDKGLILTNHHVAFGAIQQASDKDHDYLTHGFLANTMEEEIPANGYIADVLLGYEDVTAAIHKKLRPKMTAKQRYQTIESVTKQMIAKEEKKAKDLRVEIRPMYSGNKYYLFRFKRLRDVRLVYAPPRSLGNFGGDIDNWMWPRHTCDFSYLRAYVSKDNVGEPFSKENVPYIPKSWFKISLDGLKDGDFSFIMGYPGRTYRHYTVSQLENSANNMKQRIDDFVDIINFLENAGKDDREIQIKYASLVKGLNNGLKNYRGKLEGFEKYGILAKKAAAEKEIVDWINADAKRKEKYGQVIVNIENFLKEKQPFFEKERKMSGLVSSYLGSAIMAQAYMIYRAAEEGLKPDMKREPGFMKRDIPYIEMRIKMAERRYHLDTDITFFKHSLKKMAKNDKATFPKAFAEVLVKGDDAIDQFVDNLYANTIMKDSAKRLELLKKKPAELLKLNDPFINLAAQMAKEMKVLRDESKVIDQQQEDLSQLFKAVILEMKEGKVAPDANSTIRFTYGEVKGYEPRDAVTYLPFTTLKGVIEKETGEFPFEVPEKLKELHKNRDFGVYEDKAHGDIVTCFLNTTNVTGGNSGSPVLNAKGEQIGIIFDMTYESVIGDYFILPALQRTISVDIRYVLFITDKFSGATHLLKEMGFSPSSR